MVLKKYVALEKFQEDLNLASQILTYGMIQHFNPLLSEGYKRAIFCAAR